ncbi:MAG TPA: GDP-mannose pyrophosphatase NudK [Puia sp.]|nr:GDP-mannose pyrophosphatase NudK [Puia sp.]
MHAVKILTNEVLSHFRYVLRKVTYVSTRKDGMEKQQTREVYDRGNGATFLLYNPVAATIVLTRQFRLPTFLNGNKTGMLIEACAGLLEKESPEESIRRETEEETGYKISSPKKIMEMYMSPGSVSEILYFFVAEYSEQMKVGEGGGLEEENEDIEVLEMPFAKALAMVRSGEIRDAKTILLLQYAQLNELIP